jgi:aldehyde:ferredoxin oxidoreductase
MTSTVRGGILIVDLTHQTVQREPFTNEMANGFIGGRGLNANLLWDLNKPGVDPLGPENTLIFGTGLMTGTLAPSSGRVSVTCKSPATDLYLKSSVGGDWGGAFRFAGHSNLVIKGASTKPVYLWIDDDRIEFRDAEHLWGKDVRTVDALIKSELGDQSVRIAAIGPAGENQVLFAAIMTSIYNAAGRGGAGAVMGSKLLKAIVVRGTRTIEVAEPAAFEAVVAKTWEKLRSESAAQHLHLYGTSMAVTMSNATRTLPTKNFQRGYFENAFDISGEGLVEKGYLKRRVACYGCVLGCHRYTEIGDGKGFDAFSGGPEYESFASLGSGTCVGDTEMVLRANCLCNLYGLDTISTGSVIEWIFECHQRGLEFDHDGLSLQWGRGDEMLELIRKVAFREGIGELLSKGVRRASKEMGQESYKWALQAKGLEQSKVDTRSALSYALAFMVNPRGPDHLMTEAEAEFGGTPEAVDLVEKITGDRELADPLRTEGRAEIVRWHEDCYSVTDSMGICAFTSTSLYFMTPEIMAQLYSAALGEPMSEEEIMRLGRKIVTLEKCFNVREGATRADDVLPWRMMHEKSVDSPSEDAINSFEKMDPLLDRYYEMHGWDSNTSWPARETLDMLGLSEVANGLSRTQKLPQSGESYSR